MEGEVEGPVRVRVVFDDRRMLTRSQRAEGLRRCWLLLRPGIATVADLAHHVSRRFRLRRACPDGLVLSMDEFVLPSFESTCIFRDKDIIRVRKKVCKKKEIADIPDDVHCIQDSEIIEKQPILSNGEILAIESQDDVGRRKGKDEQGGSEHQDINATCTHEGTSTKKKRKDSDKSHSSKKKKQKLADPEKSIVMTEEIENIHQEQKQSFFEKGETSKKKNDEAEVNCQANTCQAQANGTTIKAPSRTALRKKAKRIYWREVKRQMKENSQSLTPANNMQWPPPKQQAASNSQCRPLQQQTLEENRETVDEVVPIVVRPGHIRFEPADEGPSNWQSKLDAGPSNLQLNGPRETLLWNGIASKKKGQKWGREKGSCRSNDVEIVYNEPASEKIIPEQGKSVDVHLDFESLFPLTRIPKEGDLIVYRLVELSSSWCPELSSYRVGKVILYDPISMRILLVPVPEYPIFPDAKEDTDESALQWDISLYKEDGTLEIDYPSLVDVRLLKGADSAAEANGTTPENTKEMTSGKSIARVSNCEVAMAKSNAQNSAGPSGSKPSSGWEQIDQALHEKKAELQENGWGTWTPNKSTFTTSSWSYSALRGSALGPTVAFLRGRNNRGGKNFNPKFRK
ncbi:Coilin [Ananas comosus]|uniref:Coilin n=1 Tax=Ananas comosus TaxID=4615 RepID=A0A199VD88_ANACO|nr:Coilin [Ananas comosus]